MIHKKKKKTEGRLRRHEGLHEERPNPFRFTDEKKKKNPWQNVEDCTEHEDRKKQPLPKGRTKNLCLRTDQLEPIHADRKNEEAIRIATTNEELHDDDRHFLFNEEVDSNIYSFRSQVDASPTEIFFCSLNYLTGPPANSNDLKKAMSITFQKHNPRCGRLKAYWWNQASMKQDNLQDDVLSTRTLFKTIKAEGLLVKPDSKKQDDVL